MNWFRENRWLGTFLIGFGFCTMVALFFLFSAKSDFEAATGQFNDATAERNRLEHLQPFPNEANFQKMKRDIVSYGETLNKTKEDLKTQVIPAAPLAPNEFQSHLRQAMNETIDKARANKIKLPEDFHLGFDEYTAALPNTAAAPLLGQELAQIQLLMSILTDAHVDSVSSLKRTRLPEESAAAAPTPAPRTNTPAGASPKMLERSVIDVVFSCSPSAARKVVNQIATATHQFFIIRTLHVRNEQEKGPARETATTSGASTGVANTTAPAAQSTTSGALKFIVGNEHIEIGAQIEIVRFTY